jgi:hypothetical protein
MAPPQPKKSRLWLWITLGIVGVLVLCGGCVTASVFGFANLVSNNPATDAVNHYYTAIKNQDYTTAYGYLDSNLKTYQGNQQLTPELFTQAGQGLDTTKGYVSSYNITSTQLNTNNGVNTANFTVSVTRNGTSYDVHLQLQEENNGWKIISYDNI